jgi:hypothetical protein
LSRADDVRRAAMQEILRPTMAFDEIRSDGEHPLQHLVEKPNPLAEYVLDELKSNRSPFFYELRKRIHSELNNPTLDGDFATRCRLANILDGRG